MRALFCFLLLKLMQSFRSAGSEMAMGREGREGTTVAMPSELLFLKQFYLKIFGLQRSAAHRLGSVIPSSTPQMTARSQIISGCH